ELIPAGDQPAATSHNNTVEPEVMTIEEFNEAGAEYSSRLIRINGLSLNDPEATDGKWKGGSNYKAADREGNEITIRTTLSKGSYIGEALPEGKFDLISIAGFYNNDVQVSPRVKEDIIAKGGDEDDCEAPTNLMYSGSTKITVKWNGSANEYKLALLSKDGKDTVMTKMLTVTEYTFGDEVKPNVEYGWAVASVCENGKLVWAKGKNFQIETANEEAELQADIYPNPTDGVVYIKLAEAARMEIFTLGGTVLRSEELSAGRNELRLDQSGIYFIRLTNGTAATVRRVVVR
ncbi:MAG: T9SS type A sorting domain-containing protein, partial [Bacteroidales bacterium]|nr:T9SS type A sorting domain-containing protein [Bacteroidales bacterium]